MVLEIMAKQIADVQIHASENEAVLEDNLDISVDLIDDGLYLGNLACARDDETLKKLGITHILTVDLVPLPRTILERHKVNFKYVKMADVPKEDLISHLPETNVYIKEAIKNGGTVLVHCYFGVSRSAAIVMSNVICSYFGVSRSAAIVIAYIMEKYCLCYEDAYTIVKCKRRFIGPNVGFVAQLKLFGHMGYEINKDDPRYKQFRLKMAGQKLNQVKILPQLFADLIKPDPGLTRERPDPIVYRCRKCRRIVASQNNILPHIPRDVKVELAKKGVRPPPSKLTGLTCAENGEILLEKLKSLACQPQDTSDTDSDKSEGTQHGGEGTSRGLDGYTEQVMVDGSITSRDASSVCRLMWFVEPMAWMDSVAHYPHGKLHCPKCRNKIGSFNWIMGCKCPCGQKVAPAFYLVPSKVEWSNIVQNVQVTV